MIATVEDSNVLEQLKAPFEESQVKKRKGPYDKKIKKNKYFTYIPVHFVRERLDEVLGFNWEWEVVDILPTTFQSKSKGEWDQETRSYVGGGELVETPGVVITGRLTVLLPSGKKVFRDGTGGASMDKGMGPGDAQKIAASNALKRAAYMFGVGSYLALESDEALDDTSTFSNDFSNASSIQNFNNPYVHTNVGQGTVAPPQFFPNDGGTTAPQTQSQVVGSPSPFSINVTNGRN